MELRSQALWRALVLTAGLWPCLPGADAPEILTLRCAGCHGAAQQMGNLRLDTMESAGRAAKRVLEMTAAGKMPPSGKLAEAELSAIREWAEGTRPWSFSPITRRATPAGEHPVDHFVRQRLAAKQLRPSAEADRRTLARRIHLDLTGLLPAPEDVEAFVRDTRPDAYERLVDRLLASPHYGEKFARHWLDLARYADSEGGVQDYGRPFAWRYRDWVIQAFRRC